MAASDLILELADVWTIILFPVTVRIRSDRAGSNTRTSFLASLMT